MIPVVIVIDEIQWQSDHQVLVQIRIVEYFIQIRSHHPIQNFLEQTRGRHGH